MTCYLLVVSLPGWGPCAGTEFPKGIPLKIRRGRLCNLVQNLVQIVQACSEPCQISKIDVLRNS